MGAKTVSFSTEPTNPSNFKTYPRKAIRSTKTDVSASASSYQSTNLDQLAMDVFNRFRLVSDIDIYECIKHLAAGNCPDLLVRYSVLNTLFKSLPNRSDDLHLAEDSALSTGECIRLIDRASGDFSSLAEKQENVLDLSILQQIMRCVEGVWARFGWECTELKSSMQRFAQKCIEIIGDRPNSKILISSAIRLASTALVEQMLSPEQASLLISVLSRTQLVNAAGFTADAVAAVHATFKLYPTTLMATQQDWVPLVIRGLASNFSITRSHALTILSNVDHDIISILDDNNERGRNDSEPLAKTMAQKLVSYSQGTSDEDTLDIIKSIILVLNAAANETVEWPYMQTWVDCLQVSLRSSPKLVATVWPSILNSKLSGGIYHNTLYIPFAILKSTRAASASNSTSSSFDSTIYTMLLDVFHHVDINNSTVWENLLAPLLKMLAPYRECGTPAAWSHALTKKGMQMTESLVVSYLDVFDVICRNTNRQDLDHLQSIWTKIAGVCQSRSAAMELVKYHYRVLSPVEPAKPESPTKHIKPASGQGTPPSPSREAHSEGTMKNKTSLGLMLSNGLLRTLDPALTVKKAKQYPHSILTLVLLPVVIFLSGTQRMEYLERLLTSNYKSQSHIHAFMMALLGTVEAGSEKQPQKWMSCAAIIQGYTAKNKNLSPLMLETLMAFVPIMKKAERSHWLEWKKLLYAADSSQQLQVLSKLPSRIPRWGLQCVIGVTGEACVNDKLRILTESIDEDNLDMIRELGSSDLVDSLARNLVQQKNVKSVQLAWHLLPNSRSFVVAKSLLSVIDELRNNDLVEFWNKVVSPNLPKSCPAFVSSQVAARLGREKPDLELPRFIIMTSNDLKRPATVETPPSSSKRPRRAILTGSVPVSLGTPPASDSLEELPPVGDELCSSPPPHSSSNGSTSANSAGAIPRNSHDKARMLKRLLMGLKMDEAVQTMKRSEQLMIYNMLFKSCVTLKTHLAETGEVKSENEVESAREELARTVDLRDQLFKREQQMTDNAKKRRQMLQSESESDDLEDDDELDEEDLTNDREYIPKIKMEV